MTQQLIDLGSSGPLHLSESIRSAFTKVNDNFTEIFTALGPGGNAIVYGNTISTSASLINLGIGDALTNGDTLRDAFIKIVNNFNTVFTVVPIAHYNINLGSGPNTQTGDTVNSAFAKINSDFTNLYTTLGLTVSNVAVNTTDFGPSYRNRLNIETVSSEHILPVVTAPFGYYGIGQQFINLGDGPDTQTGDTVREAFIKINANFSDLYQVFGANGETNLIGNTIIANNINVTDTVRSGGFFGYGNVQVEGNVIGTNFLYANGISVFSNLTADYTHIPSSMLPTANNTFTLGNTTLQWAGAYLNSANVSKDLTVGGNLLVGGNITYQNVETGNLEVANAITVLGNIVIGSGSPLPNVALQINANTAMLLPVGPDAQRPTPANAGLFRFSTTSSKIEWYTGTTWEAPITSYTQVTSNAQVADGTSISFPLPVANATTAGTIVSINGIVQRPIAAYSITANNIVFTEPPLQSDVIDIRVFTTTDSISSVADIFGNTGIFFDQVTSGEHIIYFKNNSINSATFQANGQLRLLNNIASTSYTTGQMIVTGGIGVSGNVYINDHMYAIAKSFLIDHPSKPDYKLQYTCLEGPENGVYVRGKIKNDNKIELPDYWTNLVDEQTITVDLTPIGQYQELYIEKIENNTVYIGSVGSFFYTVWAERKDIEKLKVEYPN